jgi:ferredoxin
MPKVIFEREKIQVLVPMHANLREVCVANKIPLYTGLAKFTNCHGNGRCTTCRVEVLGTASERNEIEQKALAQFPGQRLACQVEILGDLTVKTQG